MWHVDEGALHAYLDGALDEYPAPEARRVREHLETCAECAASLADERRVREEAQEILGLAAPSVEVPTFEELRAYVRSSSPSAPVGCCAAVLSPRP
jgi:anti-sigma factor RsiW